MYKSHVECIPCGHEDLLIVHLNGQAIGHDRDLYLINVYVRQDVPPDSHPVMEDVENALATYGISGDTVILGDINARTGDLVDICDTSCNFNTPVDKSIHHKDIIQRYICDKTINSCDKKLIELCQSSEHVILNSRFS